MPVTVKQVKPGVFKVVEAATGKVTKHSGTFSSKKKAQQQAEAINRSLHQQGKI